LCCFEWGAAFRGERPTVLLTHATGFHARSWDEVVRRLGDRHVITVDQRGHGRSDKRAIEHWDVFGSDLAAVVRHFDLVDVIGVGHSMGGHAAVDAAALLPDRFRGLLIIDPVIAAPESYAQGGWTTPDGEPHPIAKRKNAFASVDEMFARFEDRHPYSLFERQVLRDYCEWGLLPAPDGDGFVLACPPAIEASVYMTSRTNGTIHEHVRKVEAPVKILRAPPAETLDQMNFASSPTWPGLVHEFPNATERVLADLTHFIPMQAPHLVAEKILEEDE